MISTKCKHLALVTVLLRASIRKSGVFQILDIADTLIYLSEPTNLTFARCLSIYLLQSLKWTFKKTQDSGPVLSIQIFVKQYERKRKHFFIHGKVGAGKRSSLRTPTTLLEPGDRSFRTNAFVSRRSVRVLVWCCSERLFLVQYPCRERKIYKRVLYRQPLVIFCLRDWTFLPSALL